MSPAATVRLEVRVEGIVQGVGFRPFVYALATRLGLTGAVVNDGAGGTVDVEGERGAVAGRRGVRDRGEREQGGADRAGLARRGHLRRLPARALRPRGPPLPLRV